MRRPALVAAAVIALLAVALARHVAGGFQGIDRRAHELRAQGQTIVVPGGDLMLRDVPKAFQLLEGRFFADAHYEGEVHWYPFASAWLAASVHRLGGGDIHVTFLRCAVLATALFWAAALVLLLALIGRGALLLLPAMVWLDWLRPAVWFFPADGARVGLALFLALAVWAARRLGDLRRPWAVAAAMGGAAGLLGLWHGASFFTALAVSMALAAAHLRTCGDAWPRRLLPLPLFVAASAVALAPLLLPQLLHYGRLEPARVARLWLAPEFRGGAHPAGLWKLLLAPRGLDLFLAVVFLVGWLRDPARRLPYAPLGIAWIFSLAVAHLGFVMRDPTFPALARLIQDAMPAPPHTLHHVSLTCLAFMKALAVWWLGEPVASLLAQHHPAARARARAALPAAGVAAVLAFAVLPPRRLEVVSRGESAAFAAFAAEVSRIAGRDVVHARHPGRLAQFAPLRVLLFSSDEHANHYVQYQRHEAVALLDDHVQRGRPADADALLDRYGVRYLLEDPRVAGDDPVAARCGGEVLATHEGYRLLRRAPCR